MFVPGEEDEEENEAENLLGLFSKGHTITFNNPCEEDNLDLPNKL